MTKEEFDIKTELLFSQARENFFAYRQVINGDKLKIGWWVKDICYHLQEFYEDLINGKCPFLIIEAPPQHGKSTTITDFISWIAGKNPDFRKIFASFSERLGIRTNLALQRRYDSTVYKHIFPETTLYGRNVVSSSPSKSRRNQEILEYVDREGYFRNTTVEGAITGETLDLGIIDDPIKGRKAANSPTIRNSVWDWLSNDFFTRFDEKAGFLMILTRWHVDDPAGRLLSEMPEIKNLKYAAIATQKEGNRKEGEVLFPEHKSKKFILTRKRMLGDSQFQSLYQQTPIVDGGNLFKLEHWRYYKLLPNLRRKFIYADTAQKTKEQNDYSVFQCWGECTEGKIYLIDQIRGKWEAPDLRRMAKSFWEKHKKEKWPLIKMKVEDKSSGIGLIQDLKSDTNIPVSGIPRNTDKVFRANSVIPNIEAGNVYLPDSAPWLPVYLEEHSQFPNGSYDDQVDPTMDAIEDLLVNSSNIDYAALL